MRKTKLFRFSGILLSALLLLSSVPVYAVSNGVTATCDEAYYATTDYYGNLTEGGVVKSYATNGISSLTDYGTYDEVINLTDGTKPTVKDDMVSFDFSGKTVPEHFYFEGKTAAPFRQLPWTISVHYTLNGVPAKAEELAGKTGVVEISIDAISNKNASEYARNNYILMASAILNQDNILSLEAPGAQVQLVGNLRTVIFVGFPGEEEHFVMRIGSEDFSFGGLTFMMMPATLSQLDQIAELSKRKDDLEKNYDLLSDSLDTLLDSVSSISGSLNSTADGLDQLNNARNTVSSGKDDLYQKTDAVLSDLDAFNQSLSSLPGHLDKAQQAIDDTTDALDDVNDLLHDVHDLLEDMQSDVNRLNTKLNAVASSGSKTADDLTALGTAADKLNTDYQKLLSLLAKLQLGIGTEQFTVQGMTAEQVNEKLTAAQSLENLYLVVKRHALTQDQFLAKMLVLSGKASDEISAAAKISDMNAQITQAVQATMSADPALSQEQALHTVLTALQAEDPATYAAYQLAQSLMQLYSGVSEGVITEKDFFLAVLTNTGLTQEQANASWELFQQSKNLSNGIESISVLLGSDGFCGNTSDLLANTSNALRSITGLSDSADDLLDEVDDLLDSLDDLNDVVNTYAPDLKKTLAETKSTVSALTTTVSDTHGFLTSFESLLKSAGTDLDAGTKKTLEGLAASLRATARSLGTTSNVKSAKNNLSSIIEDTWNEYTGEKSNMLLMDSTAEAVSLTDSRNTSPQSIQVLIRTQEIEVDNEAAEDLTPAETVQTTFWQRVGQMFKDFWATITGIFH